MTKQRLVGCKCHEIRLVEPAHPRLTSLLERNKAADRLSLLREAK